MKGIERNKLCICGSGKKRKVCLCWQIELAHKKALIENEYIKNASKGRGEILQAIAIAEMINAPFRR